VHILSAFIVDAFQLFCVFPRLILSSADAHTCLTASRRQGCPQIKNKISSAGPSIFTNSNHPSSAMKTDSVSRKERFHISIAQRAQWRREILSSANDSNAREGNFCPQQVLWTLTRQHQSLSWHDGRTSANQSSSAMKSDSVGRTERFHISIAQRAQWCLTGHVPG